MKVLVIGQGGREHAMVRALRQSPSVSEVHALPGSDGISSDAVCHALNWRDFSSVYDLCRKHQMAFVVIGPEEPLVLGLARFLRSQGIPVVGPDQEAAQLEGSKVFAKKFMMDAQVPTAKYQIVRSVAETITAAEKMAPPYVLKADGLAAGKGVFICSTRSELERSADELFEKNILGAAGQLAVLETFSRGWELSYLILTNGVEYERLPLAQDHKRLGNGDEGPNTGGMGTVAPLHLETHLNEQIERRVILPTLAEIQRRGLLYWGVLFFGLMITEEGPSLLEYNCRFGDPETQVILPLVDGDWGTILNRLSQGRLEKLQFKNQSAACVVMAAPGYPEEPQKGVVISGDLSSQQGRYFLHAGTKRLDNGGWQTNGGRVLNAVGLGSSSREAIANAYKQTREVNWPGMRMRTDIGHRL